MRRLKIIFGVTIAFAASAAPAESQPLTAPAVVAATYADLADLALRAPVAAHVAVRRAVRLKDAAAAPGMSRLYVEADIASLIRGAEGLPARVSYLVDLPNLANGKAVKLRRGEQYILLASTVPGRPGELQLVAPDAQLPFTSTTADRLRSILREAARADAPPAITGIGRAFHVPGSLPGESETQIFLQTADGRPVSLSVLRRPGETPRWSVALSEIVDDAAAAPQPETLLWYRLACTLPPVLPTQSMSEAGLGHAAAIAADYGLVREQLGACARNRTRR